MKNGENRPVRVMLTSDGVETERTIIDGVKMRVDSVRVPRLLRTRGKRTIAEADIASAFDDGKERFFIFEDGGNASCFVVLANGENETKFFEGPGRFPKWNEADGMGIAKNGRNVTPCFVYEKTGLVLRIENDSLFSMPVPREIGRYGGLRALSFSAGRGSETIMAFYSDSVVLPAVLDSDKKEIERVIGKFDSLFLNERYMFLFKRDVRNGKTEVRVVSFCEGIKEKIFFVPFEREPKSPFRAAYDEKREFLVLYDSEGYGVLFHASSGKEKAIQVMTETDIGNLEYADYGMFEGYYYLHEGGGTFSLYLVGGIENITLGLERVVSDVWSGGFLTTPVSEDGNWAPVPFKCFGSDPELPFHFESEKFGAKRILVPGKPNEDSEEGFAEIWRWHRVFDENGKATGGRVAMATKKDGRQFLIFERKKGVPIKLSLGRKKNPLERPLFISAMERSDGERSVLIALTDDGNAFTVISGVVDGESFRSLEEKRIARPLSIPKPDENSFHGLFYDTEDGRAFLFPGGENGNPVEDLIPKKEKNPKEKWKRELPLFLFLREGKRYYLTDVAKNANGFSMEVVSFPDGIVRRIGMGIAEEEKRARSSPDERIATILSGEDIFGYEGLKSGIKESILHVEPRSPFKKRESPDIIIAR